MDKSSSEVIDVSILIVSFNNFQILENCIDSIIKHTIDVKYEIIVIDNNSNEGNIDTVTSKFNEVVLIKNNENYGFAKANNIAARYAKGRFILLLNNDTLFIENSIKKVYEFANNFDEKVFIGCRLLNQNGSIQDSTFEFPGPWNLFVSNFFLYKISLQSNIFDKASISKTNSLSPIETEVVIGAFIFMKKIDFLKLGGFDERFFFYHEDSDLCKRFKDDNGKVFYFPDTRVIHLGGATVKKYRWFHYENRSIALIKFLQKHYGSFILFICLLFHYTGIFIRIPLSIAAGILLLKKEVLVLSYYYFKLLFIYPKNEFKF